MMQHDNFIESVKAGKIPISPPAGIENTGCFSANMNYWEMREICTERGMWALVDLQWTKQLAAWIGSRTCLEIMAGRGWLAKALTFYGIHIVATDNDSWDERHSKIKNVYQIIRSDALEAIKNGKDLDILICSWPPMDNTMTQAARLWGTKRPIVYIGEHYWGCNANDEFFDHFDSEPFVSSFTSWPSIHDDIYIGYWKE